MRAFLILLLIIGAAGGPAAEVALDRARVWSGRSVDKPGGICFT